MLIAQSETQSKGAIMATDKATKAKLQAKAQTAQVRRILSVFRSADAEQMAQGLEWYTAANTEARDIANWAGVSVAQASGIIAALSPQTPWGANLAWAREVASGSPVSHGLGASQNKAMAILYSGADSDPLDILGGPKVRAFYLCILEAGLTDAVCVDRHAYDIATGKRGSHLSLTAKRTRETQSAYRAAALRLQATGEAMITAAQLQAITWVTWRARYWSKGAWDGVRDTFDAHDRGRAPMPGAVAF